MRTAAGAALALLGLSMLSVEARDRRLFGVPVPAKPVVIPGKPIDPELLKLVEALGSENYREREKAGQTIEAKGEKVLPDLRRAIAKTESPEIARRLTILIRRMDHERLVAPKRVTFSMKDCTAKAALDEIAKQTGYRIQFNNNGGPLATNDQKYSFEFDKTPFWVAVDKIADTANLGVFAEYDDDIIRVNSYQNSLNPFVSYAGPFRFTATGINSSRNVQLSGLSKQGFQNNSSESIGFSFQINSEPKNPILGTLPAEVTLAVDDMGSSLIPPKDPNNQFRTSYYQNGNQRGHNAYGNLGLVRGAKDATTLKHLKGKIGIILLAGIVPEIVIDDPLKVKNKTIGGRTVEVTYDSMTENNGQYSTTITFKKLGVVDQNNFDYNWSNSVWQKLELVDAQGRKYNSYGPNSISHNGTTVQITISYGKNNRQGQEDKLGPPAKLIINEWLQVTHDVTFEFKDIPLP
jgi:hypothetical protein